MVKKGSKKEKIITTRVFVFGRHAKQNLTLLSGRNMLLSLLYSASTLNAFFQISKMNKSIKKRKISDIGWESREQKS